MVGYFLLIILVIVGGFLIYAGNRFDNDGVSATGVVLTVVFSTLLIVASINFACKSSDAASFKKDRDYYQELVNSISDDMSPSTITRIILYAENINTKIENNKKNCNNKMWGFLSSKEIAKVEPIKIPKYKFSVEVEE